MLSPAAAAVPAPHPAVARLQEELADDMADDDDDGEGDLDDDDDVNAPGEARLPGALNCKLVPDPPRLGEWREKLFHVDEPIVMTHDECVTPSSPPFSRPSPHLTLPSGREHAAVRRESPR